MPGGSGQIRCDPSVDFGGIKVYICAQLYVIEFNPWKLIRGGENGATKENQWGISFKIKKKKKKKKN